MSYTNLELLRKQLSDPFKDGFDRQKGDGEATLYKLSHGNVKDDSYLVYVNNSLQTETTHYAIDQERGTITFVTAPGDEIEVEVTYQFSSFSDTELTNFFELDGSVDKALIRCIDILLVDSARYFDYSSGQSELKPSQIFKNLESLRKITKERLSEGQSGGVTVVTRSSPYFDSESAVETDLSRADLGEVNE